MPGLSQACLNMGWMFHSGALYFSSWKPDSCLCRSSNKDDLFSFVALITMWYWFSHVSGVVKSYFMQLWDLPFLSHWCPCHRNIFPHDHDMLLLFFTKWAFSKTSFIFPGFRWILFCQLVHKQLIICLLFWLLTRLLVGLKLTSFII